MADRAEAVFRRVVGFLGAPEREESIRAGVEFASLENMRRMEQQKTSWLSGGRMKPSDPSNPQSYKVRRAKVGGYGDHFDAAEAAEIDALVREGLAPVYGYGSEPAVSARADS